MSGGACPAEAHMQRIYSGSLFLLGFLVMALSSSTAFFATTPLNEFGNAGMGLFGLLLCLISFGMLAAAGGVVRGGPQWRFYSVVLFLAGLYNIVLGILTVFFRLTQAGTTTALLQTFGGLVLCLISAFTLSAAATAERTPDFDRQGTYEEY
jgi:hypothetical protein